MARRSATYLKYLVALSTAGIVPLIAAPPAMAATSANHKVSSAAVVALSAGIVHPDMQCWGEWGQWSQWGQWGQWSQCGAEVTASSLTPVHPAAAQSLHEILRSI